MTHAAVPEPAVFCRRCERPYQAVDAMWSAYDKMAGPVSAIGPNSPNGRAREDVKLFALVTIADALSAIAEVLAPEQMRKP